MEQRIGAALAKRVKRHVAGRPHLFFVNTSPGLSRLCRDEVASIKAGSAAPRIVSGGIAFEGRLIDCFAANLHLRTANRILMRVTSFSATNFRQLERHLSRLPWELYLRTGSKLRVCAASRHSRLYHTEAVSEKVRQCIADRWAVPGTDPDAAAQADPGQTLYIRALDDRITVSVDSSGALLHKRGRKAAVGAAPIRETLAAAVLKWAGYRPDTPLVDPMCGSGTFALEAAFMAKQIPPGYFRTFAFMGWPAFRPKQWDYLKRTAGEGIRPLAQPLIFASDTEARLVHRVETAAAEYGVSDALDAACKDFFALSPKGLVDRPGLVVLNPPYGHRIGSRDESRRLYAAIHDKLAADFSGWTCALMVPARQACRGKLVQVTSHPIRHGGLPLKVLIGTVP